MIRVSNFSELKSAVEGGKESEIVVTNDITFASGGIKVNLSNPNLVIDFGFYNVTDNNSSTFTDTIYISGGTTTISVTVKNAVWSGRNYYGVVGVYDGNVNATINLENITYVGPQFVYNKSGTTKISNCNVTLDKNGSNTNPQEFCEANRLVISGNVVVNSKASGDAVIWFTNANSALTVESNATFQVDAMSTYLMYTDTSPVLLFKSNSNTTINTLKGLFYASGSGSHIASSFTLEQDARFSSSRIESNTVPMFKCTGEFSVGKNATFQLYSTTINSSSLMYFGKTTTLNFDNPKNVVLYNNGGDIFKFQSGSASASNIINIDTQLLRLWNYAKIPSSDPGNFDDTPTTEYYKKDYLGNLTLKASLSSSAVVAVESNIVDEDSGYPVSTAIKLLSSKVLSMGSVPLEIGTLNDMSKSITGYTIANGNMKINFLSTAETLTAGSLGTFELPLESTLAISTPVTIGVNKDFLTRYSTFLVNGSVNIVGLETLDFPAIVVPNSRSIFPRNNADWQIDVYDSRITGGDWYLYATVTTPLTSDNNTIDDAIIFRQDSVDKTMGVDSVLVYTGTWQEGKTTNIKWSEIEGILLKLEPEKMYSSGKYITQIDWEITELPK